ncbi:MAG TPA: hypothetical protein PKN52_10750 [Trueperaceae bacterium]|nr:hypothetical protein [Trueperaceae bacterium]
MSTGTVLLLAGAALLLRQLGSHSLFFELVWLAAIVAGAAAAFRSLAGRVPFRVRLIVHAAFGLFALFSLNRLAGAALFGFVALYFWLLFTSPRPAGQRPATWQVLVAGVVGTLALLTGADALMPAGDNSVILFLGVTATFTAIYLLPKERGGARWALWPALAWAALTLLINDPSGGLARWLLPLALIGAGVAFLGYMRGRG